MEAPISSSRSNHPPITPKTGTRKTYEEVAVGPMISMPLANKTYDRTVETIPRYAIANHSASLGYGIGDPQFSTMTHGDSKIHPVIEYQTTISSDE